MRRRWKIAMGVLLVGAAAAAWSGRGVYTTAHIGSGYVAKQTCSCIFVAGRSAAACSRDYDQQAARLLNVEIAASSVTVRALGGVWSARAEFEAGFGCHLVN
jgi:hypothetical protein